MKLKEFIYLVGFRPKPRRYGYRRQSIRLPDDGEIEFARWLHPKAQDLQITADEVQQLRRFLRPGDVAIDIGAHCGDSTLPIALACGSSGAVLALEPNPYVFEILEINARLNRRKTNIIPLCYAVTDSNGVFTFRYNDPGYINGGDFSALSIWRHACAFPLDVQGRRLQHILRECFPGQLNRLRYIKIDTEGHDARVLRSIPDMLRQHRPYIKAEIYKHMGADERTDLHRFLSEIGYEIFKVDGGTLFTEQCLNAGDITRWPHFDIFAVPQM